MARPRIITLLMPLPTYYNPDTQGVRKPIEKWEFTRTAEEISKHFDAGAELQVFRRDKSHGFWWDRGLLAKDVLAYISRISPTRRRPASGSRLMRGPSSSPASSRTRSTSGGFPWRPSSCDPWNA